MSQRRGQQHVLPARACRVQTVQYDGQILLEAQVQSPEHTHRGNDGHGLKIANHLSAEILLSNAKNSHVSVRTRRVLEVLKSVSTPA